MDNSVKLFRVLALSKGIQLTLEKKFPIKNSKHHLRSCFCPLISIRNAACFACGSEDGSIHIFRYGPSVIKEKVNQLQGHTSVVTDVSWNYDESLLASSDTTGTVILWKRVKHVEN
eukprot:TRINITY_DN4718_c0_g1_i3.p2 TRINITY_DN4718_c0_g1~~TRINITY_DN4718_c0_g1_i3.p2  ORF type:complete len:116 (-),score=15.64 TRINITY_DN4718_c0_g1_i3:60-407(-)